MSVEDIFKARPLEEVYEDLWNVPPQTSVDIGPGLSVKLKDNGTPVVRLHYDAIPERNRILNPIWSAPSEDRDKYGISIPEWKLVNERGEYTATGWDREQEISDEAGGGDRLFASTISTFKQFIVITDEDWMPKNYWRVLGGFDHGKTNATVLERAYVDEFENVYMCGEFYQYRTETYANNVWQNIPVLQQMPDLDRMEWCRADPSIFYDKELQADGSFTNINAIYRKNGFRRLTAFPGAREDLTMEERVNEYWKDLPTRFPVPEGHTTRGMLYIVCRNESERRQPGLHPWDCPNLLWELKRMRRKELSGRQLLTRNPTEQIVDKDNHAFDALKYLILSLPKPAAIPLEKQLAAVTEGLNPMSAAIAAERFVRKQGGFELFQQRINGGPNNRPKPKQFSLKRGARLL